MPTAAKTPVLFFAPFRGALTGGPRTLLELVSHLRGIRPIVTVLDDGPIRQVLLAHGVETHALLRRHTRRAELSALQRAGTALGLSRRIQVLARSLGVRALWARNVVGVTLCLPAKLTLRLPLLWDIGMEPASTGAMRALHGIATRGANAIVSQSRSQLDSVFGAPLPPGFETKLQVLLPGLPHQRAVELDAVARRRAQSTAREPTILCIATIHPRKNQLLLIQALAHLRNKFPDARLELVGPIEDRNYEDELRRTATRLDLAEQVRFVAWEEDIAARFASCAVAVVCSSNEGVPHVVREGLWAGVPLVATRVGGIPDVIVHEHTGLLVPENDPADLANALSRILSDTGLALRLGRNGREFARHALSPTGWLTRYEELIHSLVGQSW